MSLFVRACMRVCACGSREVRQDVGQYDCRTRMFQVNRFLHRIGVGWVDEGFPSSHISSSFCFSLQERGRPQKQSPFCVPNQKTHRKGKMAMHHCQYSDSKITPAHLQRAQGLPHPVGVMKEYQQRKAQTANPKGEAQTANPRDCSGVDLQVGFVRAQVLRGAGCRLGKETCRRRLLRGLMPMPR